jgi:hypothetical protein
MRKENELGMTTHRIEALTDGIFAIAMTLLVLNLALPETGNGLTQTVELHKLLIGQTPKFFSYALSFLLLAIYWVLHHRQFHFIKRTEGFTSSAISFYQTNRSDTSLDKYCPSYVYSSGSLFYFFGWRLFRRLDGSIIFQF